MHESHRVKQSSTELHWCCQLLEPSLCCRNEGKQLEEDNGHNMSEIETQKAAVEDAKAQQQYYQVHQQATQQKVGNLHAVPPDRTPVHSVSLQIHDTRSGTAWTSQCIAMSLAILLLQGTASATTQYMFWCCCVHHNVLLCRWLFCYFNAQQTGQA